LVKSTEHKAPPYVEAFFFTSKNMTGRT